MEDETFRVFSWNILAPLFVRPAPPGVAPYSEFRHCADEFLVTDYRQRIICQQLAELHADAVCMQEVQLEKVEGVWSFPVGLASAVPEMEWVIPPLSEREWKNLEERNKRACGEEAAVSLAMGYRRDKFELVRVLSNQRGLVLFLKSRVSGVLLAVCDVHLEGHPDLVEERKKQLYGTLKRARREEQAHVVILGDCNARWKEVQHYDATRELQHVRTGYTWHGFHGNPRSIDHIFHDSSLAVVETLEHFNEIDLEQGMPNQLSPSDHAPLGVVLRIAGEPVQVAQKKKKQNAVSDERKEQIQQLINALKNKKPPAHKGKPSPEQLAALKAFAQMKKDLVEGLEEDEKAFAKKVLKKV